MPDSPNKAPSPQHSGLHPFRKAVLRGLGILMPPLLTLALFLWAWNLIEAYVLVPVENVAEVAITWYTSETLRELPFPEKISDPAHPGEQIDDPRLSRVDDKIVSFNYDRRIYTSAGKGKWVGYYPSEYVRETHLRRSTILAPFLGSLILVLYLLGKFVAAGVGHMIVGIFDRLILQLPLISNVYSAVKQVTDFVFVEREIEFNRVVAIEYPRKGIWSVGFVTGESMLDIRQAASEPVLSVLMPTSPMPVTGFTITVLKREAVDLNISIDQAIQFVVSCGVVVAPHQQMLDRNQIAGRVTDAIASHVRDAESPALQHTDDAAPQQTSLDTKSDTQESTA